MSAVCVSDLAKQYARNMSTISMIIKQKAAIKAVKQSKGITIISKRRSTNLEEMECPLLLWIRDKEITGNTITEMIICEEACAIYCALKAAGSGGDVGESSIDPTTAEFKASRSWSDKFKKQTGIHSVVRHGEASSSETKAANEFVKQFKIILQEEGYIEQQGFNYDETGLFLFKLPSQTYITAEEKKMPGYKPMNDQLTLALCEDCKIKPLLVYHSENPRAFKAHKVNRDLLQVFWRANAKIIDQPWEGVTRRTLNSAWKKLLPEAVVLRDFESFGPEPASVPVPEDNMDEIVSIGKSMGLEVDEDDITELV
ncbi:tigger transposable element-derived protein 1-like [Palaemon carinicauda]|uniref:tigger transposable element-derived protein 1-like n=1 Tax=Palaemon carinicauda TaxID=392227 RepID=UPI0035B597F6